MAKVLISYFSKSGHTKKMAEYIKEGLDSLGDVDVDFKKVQDTTMKDLRSADGIIIGSPTYFGVMATEVKHLMDKSIQCYGKLVGKVGGAFTSSGMIGGGNETTIMSILQGLLIHGMIVQGVHNGNHYGPVSVGAPDKEVRDECVQYGKMIGELVKKLG
ncbi:MAG: NAD(P)H-dependent oxidoreductase [Deltaproteobacteria bacterium]|nr:NAD(P)H-dependent oxidoreductase [Deltaproteobacteria bacterium]MBW2019210.1 NAD(P)H-dependent oxidoreductase [Deltaproteobacteria bacterium]MBW2074016.1 NAD(P)H-dependent oxidoreductase [Deltaproteobacteria bacterium]RLB80366.1 MAG: flavodoxin family protein [Deltaproteobacteria bacterium]